MVVDFDGRILAQADPGPGEKIVVAEIDLEALRAARRQRLGHNPLAHLRGEAYGALSDRGFPAGTFAEAQDPLGECTIEDNERAIKHVIGQNPWK